jgi:hypothetical protein
MTTKPLYPIIPRRSKLTGRIELFMLDGEGSRRELLCYDPQEGHSSASYEYYLYGTKYDSSPEALAVFTSYTNDWEGESNPVLRQRLPR